MEIPSAVSEWRSGYEAYDTDTAGTAVVNQLHFATGDGWGWYGMVNSNHQIDQKTAKKMMEAGDGHAIVDVRRQDEFNSGHIPGAILIPNEAITDTRPEQLPDLDQIILIYCRSGNRSKQAAQKLFDMGYTNVYEFGGINTWTGDIVTGGEPAILSFDSFDGGGPEYVEFGVEWSE